MISVVVADAHALIRAGIEAVLVGTRFRIVAACANGAEALDAIESHDPVIALLCNELPGMSGIEVLQTLRAARDQRTVVMLADTITDHQLRVMMRVGIQGFVSKSSEAPELLAALEHTSSGQRAIPAALLERARVLAQQPEAANSLEQLTSREQSIAGLVAQGLKNRDIAAQLGIGEGTVKVYLHTIYAKLGIANRTALATLAIRMVT
ncbi:response regulator transcription factor [Novosphingobium sp. Chol11]|uniref:LuxR C-terminal-related transcriptional regulator n=1 Tax=Novosphingobium sp. Chol11 TaxID=1385763 RepID=UPI0025E9DB17|nr:response regulator transcription factor [Novosphingobium sp. Chol11]